MFIFDCRRRSDRLQHELDRPRLAMFMIHDMRDAAGCQTDCSAYSSGFFLLLQRRK